MRIYEICKSLIELAGRRKEKRSRQEGHPDMNAAAFGLDTPLSKLARIHFLHVDVAIAAGISDGLGFGPRALR